jgi:rhodanese-related sulfurtransferase
MSDFISSDAVRRQQESGPAPVIIDVRDGEEYRAGHIPGAIHIPAGEIEERLDEIPLNRPIVPY